AQAGGNAGRDDLCRAADRVPRLAALLDERNHPVGRLDVGTADDVRRAVRTLLDIPKRHLTRIVDLRDNLPHLADVTDDAPPERGGDELLGDRAGGDAGHRFAGAGAASAAVVAVAVLGVEREVGVPGPVLVLDVGI